MIFLEDNKLPGSAEIWNSTKIKMDAPHIFYIATSGENSQLNIQKNELLISKD